MITNHTIASREEYEAAREELLTREKEHTRLGDELAEQRRQLPWVPVEKEYRFDYGRGPADPWRALRRSLPALGLPLHVRAELRGRLPGQLVDGRRL